MAYEGKRSSLGRGFHRTTRTALPDLVATEIRAFDDLLDDAMRYTVEEYMGKATRRTTERKAGTRKATPQVHRKPTPMKLRGATILGLRRTLDRMESSPPSAEE